MPFDIKFGIYMFALAIAILLAFVAVRGWQSARRHEPLTIEAHRGAVSLMLLLVVALILCIRSAVGQYHVAHGPLFGVHLPFALIGFAALLAVWLRFDGQRYPRAHRYIVYPTIACLVVVTVLGSIMVYRA